MSFQSLIFSCLLFSRIFFFIIFCGVLSMTRRMWLRCCNGNRQKWSCKKKKKKIYIIEKNYNIEEKSSLTFISKILWYRKKIVYICSFHVQNSHVYDDDETGLKLTKLKSKTSVVILKFI